MSDWIRTLRSAFVSGSAASITSTLALALLARAEGKTASQPINATSHWLNRSEAGSFKGVDIAHTAVGYATHHAATLFWAVLFEWWDRRAATPAASGAIPARFGHVGVGGGRRLRGDPEAA